MAIEEKYIKAWIETVLEEAEKYPSMEATIFKEHLKFVKENPLTIEIIAKRKLKEMV